MSRTYKDVPHRLTWKFKNHDRVHEKREYFYDYENDTINTRCYEHVFKAYDRVYHPVGRPEYYHCMPTPSWWIRVMMNRPQRRAGHIWERQVLLHDLEETDPPDVSKKPHIYYW